MTVFVAALSILLIKKKYKLIHYISIIISTAGMVIVILEDLKTDTNKGEIVKIFQNVVVTVLLEYFIKWCTL